MKNIFLSLILLCGGYIYSQQMPNAAQRYGWYFDMTSGLGMHFELDSIHNKFPNGVHTEAHSTFLNEIDLGYRFENNFSLALGLEFNNFVDIQYVLDTKWSFMADNQVQPYAYLCWHGGITDIMVMSVHGGFGIDFFMGERSYFILDSRIGPSWASAEEPFDPLSGERNIDMHWEGALSFGLGFYLGKGKSR